MIVKWIGMALRLAAKWIGLGLGLAACSAVVLWLLVHWPVVFVCVLGSGVGLALTAYWVKVFGEHRREYEEAPLATVDGRPVRNVEVMPR